MFDACHFGVARRKSWKTRHSLDVSGLLCAKTLRTAMLCEVRFSKWLFVECFSGENAADSVLVLMLYTEPNEYREAKMLPIPVFGHLRQRHERL